MGAFSSGKHSLENSDCKCVYKQPPGPTHLRFSQLPSSGGTWRRSLFCRSSVPSLSSPFSCTGSMDPTWLLLSRMFSRAGRWYRTLGNTLNLQEEKGGIVRNRAFRRGALHRSSQLTEVAPCSHITGKLCQTQPSSFHYCVKKKSEELLTY